MKEFSIKTIYELVADNHSVASALHFLGIHFYHYSEMTLQQACERKGLDINVVINRIVKTIESGSRTEIRLVEYPLDLVLEYLKHSHYLYIKEKIPFLSD